ncbi:DUF932 domain-containing protein [Xanthomonas campestris]|uniref:DUF932 domain-containing protein n=1 Tax=Xanthomonas campestris TaxID=339 RepID=UPI003CCF0F44
MHLASRFASRSPSLRSDYPLSDDQIRSVAPSIFADAPHESRSERYAYIPTAAVLTELRKEGFQPFMEAQTRVRSEDRRDYTKHMIRLRQASQINGAEANEIVLLNSNDGTSSYQMLPGMFRFVCSNDLVCGDTVADVRVPHKGDVAGSVIEGAYEVLSGFDRVKESRDSKHRRGASDCPSRIRRWRDLSSSAKVVGMSRALGGRIGQCDVLPTLVEGEGLGIARRVLDAQDAALFRARGELDDVQPIPVLLLECMLELGVGQRDHTMLK